VYAISEHVFNSEDAPPVIAFGITFHTAALLQFLNQQTDIIIEYEDSVNLPESYFLLTVANNEFNAVEIGRTNEYVMYAVGDKALMFAASQRR
jgi:hypothetical protein